jgi:hypothetical protein
MIFPLPAPRAEQAVTGGSHTDAILISHELFSSTINRLRGLSRSVIIEENRADNEEKHKNN